MHAGGKPVILEECGWYGGGTILLNNREHPERTEAEDATLRALLEELAARLPAVAGYRLTSTVLEDESWRDAWKRFFRAHNSSPSSPGPRPNGRLCCFCT